MSFRGRKHRQRLEQQRAAQSAVAAPVERPMPPAPAPRPQMRDDLGPIEGLLADQSVSAILVNGPQDVYVERNDNLVRADVQFTDADEVLSVILGIAHRAQQPLDDSSPTLD